MLTKEQFQKDLLDAIRSKNEIRKSTLRMLLSAIKLAEVEKIGLLDEAGLAAVIRKEVKMRNETIEHAQRAGRQDLLAALHAELDVLQAYLPQALTEEELEAMTNDVITELGARGPQDMGKVVKALLGRTQGRTDGKTASKIVQRLLEAGPTS